jgi:biotin operon repressor
MPGANGNMIRANGNMIRAKVEKGRNLKKRSDLNQLLTKKRIIIRV